MNDCGEIELQTSITEQRVNILVLTTGLNTSDRLFL